ncbi:MAG: hypothetical protein PHQ60_12330 [Sideroxydans sp.]|nr:hypothetical protein [Sideroxydans sp.]
MTVKYFQILSGSEPPDISALKPFRTVVIVEDEFTPEWQSTIATWLVKSGCLYMMAWGKDCSSWDDAVDFANLEEFNFGEIPEDKDAMTTWHENEPLNEVFWFAKNSAHHPSIDLPNTILLDISRDNRETELLTRFAEA